MESIPMWLLVVLVVAAVVVGLWVGNRAGTLAPGEKPAQKKTLGARARDAATRGVISLWKWNRRRKSEKKKDE